MNFQCTTEFNVENSLKPCGQYKKALQESTDPLKYIFDIKPSPMCYMPGQNFQGIQMTTGEKRPPPQLLDMEMTLQAMPLKEEENDYVIKNIHNAKPPAMPSILSNRLVIPDCGEILSSKRTKIRFGEAPDVPQRVERMGFYNTNYMRPGMDTRQEWKDKFAEYEKTKQKENKNNVYGIGAFDKRALKPGTNPKCTNADSNLGCMHVYGPDAKRTGKMIDSTRVISDLVNRPVGTQLNMPLAATKMVADSIDPKTPYIDLIRDPLIRQSCNARFYDYTPPC
jgi:hypothetical protein